MRFSIREEREELEKLDKALKVLGYKDRSDWYRDMKRKAIREAEELELRRKDKKL